MVKLFQSEHTFEHPFSRVSAAWWRKYPNASAPHVKAIDCYDRTLIRVPRTDKDALLAAATRLTAASTASAAAGNNNKRSELHLKAKSSDATNQSHIAADAEPLSDLCLVSHRVLCCEIALPARLKALNVPCATYALETCIINPVTREMIVKSRNLTGNSMMTVEETCTYKQSPLNPQHTQYTQEATIKSILPFVGRQFENTYLTGLELNSQRGLSTIESLCNRIKQFGVQSLLDDLRHSAKSIPTVAGQLMAEHVGQQQQ